MEVLRQYILSVTVAAIFCGLVLSIVPRGQFQLILKLICGVFLALLVIEPITRLDPQQIFTRFTGNWETEGEAAAAFGKEMARDTMSAYIKREAEAYILDKARELGFDVDAEVFVGKGDLAIPEQVTIRGNMPEMVRRELEGLIRENLGIAKENLEWIG